MVRFSDIIKTDNKSIRKILAPERDLPAEEPVEIGEKAAGAIDSRVPTDLLPEDTGSEKVRTCYRQLLDEVIDLRGRVLRNQEISPSPVVAIFRRIIDDNLIDELFEYAKSVPDDFGPLSHIVSVTLAHLKVGKKTGYDTNKLLKWAFASLLHNVDMDELPDSILKEDLLSQDDLAAIRKHPVPTLDMLAHLLPKTSPPPMPITEDLEESLALQLLGIIPHEDGQGIRKSMKKEGRSLAHDSYLSQSMHLVSHFAHKSALAGSFRALRTNLLFLGLGEKIKTLAVTSGCQGEGKTTVSANLAITMAQAGLKTLLAGADLKKPSASKSMAVEISPGMTDVLFDNYPWRNVIKTLSDIMIQDEEMLLPDLYNLHIITNGTAPLIPEQLLDAKRMTNFIEETKKEYDIVIFDTSPSLSTTDPLVFGSKVDAILLVSRSEGVSADRRKEVATQLSQSNYNIMGMILNDVKGEGDKDIFLHVNNTGLEQEATDKMEESDNAYKELAEIATEQKTGSLKLLLGLFFLAVIVVGALWLSGILSFDRTQETKQVASIKQEPVLHKKKITPPIQVPKPGLSPSQEASPLPDKKSALEVDKGPLSEKIPAKSKGEIETSPTYVTPVPSSPQTALKSREDLSSDKTVSYPYALHMGSFKTIQLAEKSVADLRAMGLFPYWTRVDLGQKGEWFRVFVGSFEDAEKADAFQIRHGIKADRILKTAYAVQIGFYKSKEELNQKISSLKETGHFPYYIEQPQNRYQLLIGAFQTRRAAEALAGKLKKSGLDCEMILR